MGKRGKSNKIRADFRKKYAGRTRKGDLTREFDPDNVDEIESPKTERVSGKGELTRKRTVTGATVTETDGGFQVELEVDEAACLKGRVLSVHGLASHVISDDGDFYRCATRGLLKSLSTDQRNVVAAGDMVWFLPEDNDEGIIERVEPRHGILSRTSRGRQHVIVANVDQLLIVTSCAEPVMKPNLIDRFLVTAEKAQIRPVVCINKADLVDQADLQPLIGVYGQLGYEVLLVSAETGQGVDRLRRVLRGTQSVLAGQSGVGKSSLLNAVEEGLDLRVSAVSSDNHKGKHTTTSARLIPLSFGGFVVDTPGIRQFQLWDIVPEEIDGFFRDIRPLVSQCRYPDCTHTHEVDCAVKSAVADGYLDVRRYESYCHMHSEE